MRGSSRNGDVGHDRPHCPECASPGSAAIADPLASCCGRVAGEYEHGEPFVDKAGDGVIDCAGEFADLWFRDAQAVLLARFGLRPVLLSRHADLGGSGQHHRDRRQTSLASAGQQCGASANEMVSAVDDRGPPCCAPLLNPVQQELSCLWISGWIAGVTRHFLPAGRVRHRRGTRTQLPNEFTGECGLACSWWSYEDHQTW